MVEWIVPLLILHEGLCHLYVVWQPFDVDDAFGRAWLRWFHYYLATTLPDCLLQPRPTWSQNGICILCTSDMMCDQLNKYRGTHVSWYRDLLGLHGCTAWINQSALPVRLLLHTWLNWRWSWY